MIAKDLLNEKVTLIAKTFERPRCVKKMLESVRKFYPDIRLIIVDDSKDPEPLTDCEYLILPYDSGVSAGRNHALKHVETLEARIIRDGKEQTIAVEKLVPGDLIILYEEKL